MKIASILPIAFLAACGGSQQDQNASSIGVQNAANKRVAAVTTKPALTSAHTKYDNGHCKVIEEDKETGDAISRCEGYADIPLFVTYSDARDDLDAGVQNRAVGIEGPIHHISDTIEWRLADGKPFAIIYRVEASPPYRKWSRVIVETIGTEGKPGCPIADLDGLRPNVSAAARVTADMAFAGKARCLERMD